MIIHEEFITGLKKIYKTFYKLILILISIKFHISLKAVFRNCLSSI